jgi:hypothetical protein
VLTPTIRCAGDPSLRLKNGSTRDDPHSNRLVRKSSKFPQTSSFSDNSFDQVAGVVDVVSLVDCDVISEKLQRNDF